MTNDYPGTLPGLLAMLVARISFWKEIQMKFRPLNDKVLIERDKKDEKTPGGIIIPDTAEQKVTQGTVVSVGRGRITEEGKLIEPCVKTGDKVVFEQYAGQVVQLDGREFLIVREENIRGVVED